MTQPQEATWWADKRQDIVTLVGHLLGGDGATRAAMRAKTAEGANNLILECAARMVRSLDIKCGDEVPELSKTDQLSDKEIETRMRAASITR